MILANRTDQDAALGKHRHRGAVNAITLKGQWWSVLPESDGEQALITAHCRYEEYDWRAGPGDYVTGEPVCFARAPVAC